MVTNPTKPVVAHFANTYFKLSQNWIRTQVEHTNTYQPIILTMYTANIPENYSYTCYALREKNWSTWLMNRMLRKFFGYFPSFYNKAQQNNVQLIHAHFGQNGYSLIPLAKALKVPLVTTFYGEDASRLPFQVNEWQKRYKTLFSFGTYFLVEGNHLGKQLQRLGCPASKILIQHLGVQLEYFPFTKRELKRDEPLRILVAGRFTEKKGIVYAVMAFAQLIAKGTNARLTIIGDADNKNAENMHTKKKIVDTINQTGLAEKITLMGMQPLENLRQAYYKHHIFFAPSIQAKNGDNEGGAPVTIIEACATGMPVVSSLHCDIPEVIKNEKTGLLATERNVQQLSDYLHFLAAQPEKITELGLKARQHIEDQYDATKQGTRLEKIYDQVLCQ